MSSYTIFLILKCIGNQPFQGSSVELCDISSEATSKLAKFIVVHSNSIQTIVTRCLQDCKKEDRIAEKRPDC